MSRRRQRLAALLLRLYPPAWRARYEDEMRAVLEQHPIRLVTLVDLAASALGVWLEPAHRSKERSMRKHIRCSFCGRGKDEVKRLVAGPGVYICDACVGLCNEVLASATPPGQPGCDPSAPARGSRRPRPVTWLRNIFHTAAPAAS